MTYEEPRPTKMVARTDTAAPLPMTPGGERALEEMQQSGTLSGNWWMLEAGWQAVERLAQRFAGSDMVPEDFKGKPGNCFVALSAGLPLGLSPLACLQSVAVINGRPTLWGDAPAAMVLANPSLQEFSETVTGTIRDGDREWSITVVRKLPNGQTRTITRTYSVDDAKQAKLWMRTGRNGTATPWVTNPDRMLYNRCRAFALRDSFADVLSGVTLAADLFQDGETVVEAEARVHDTPAEPEAVPDEPDVVSTGDGFDPEPPKKRKARHTLKRPKSPRMGDTFGNTKKGEPVQVFVDEEGTSEPVEDLGEETAAALFAKVHPHAELVAFVDPDFQVAEGEAEEGDAEPATEQPSDEAPTDDLIPETIETPPAGDDQGEPTVTDLGEVLEKTKLPEWAKADLLQGDITGNAMQGIDHTPDGKPVLVNMHCYTRPWQRHNVPAGYDGDLAIRFVDGRADRPDVVMFENGTWSPLSDEQHDEAMARMRAAFSADIASWCRKAKKTPDDVLELARKEPVIGLAKGESFKDMTERQLMLTRALLWRDRNEEA